MVKLIGLSPALSFIRIKQAEYSGPVIININEIVAIEQKGQVTYIYIRSISQPLKFNSIYESIEEILSQISYNGAKLFKENTMKLPPKRAAS